METKDCYEDSHQCGDECLNCDNCADEPKCPVALDPVKRENEGKYCHHSIIIEDEIKAGTLKIVGRISDVCG